LLPQNVKYKVVVITGAARGIGRQLALQISPYCDFLLLIDKEGDLELSQTATACSNNGAKTFFEIVDVRERSELQKVMEKQLSRFNEVDLVIANAGISPLFGKPPSHEENISLMETNFFGVVNTFECFSFDTSTSSKPKVRRLVAIGSIASLVSTHNSGFYSASKAALSMYLDSLRLLSLKFDIQVHEIVCGFVDTRVNNGLVHARALAIPDNVASRLILKAIRKRSKRVHSVPRFRNVPWFVLQLLPNGVRNTFLNLAYKLIYGDKKSSFL